MAVVLALKISNNTVAARVSNANDNNDRLFLGHIASKCFFLGTTIKILINKLVLSMDNGKGINVCPTMNMRHHETRNFKPHICCSKSILHLHAASSPCLGKINIFYNLFMENKN